MRIKIRENVRKEGMENERKKGGKIEGRLRNEN